MSGPRCCAGKNKYWPERFAWKMARRWSSKLGEDIRAYRCRACSWFHIGHPRGASR